ncbi:MAG: glycosyltransferase [Pirellulales bacterium]|nr:glycosyltransferase [Pirellulales bacterium]
MRIDFVITELFVGGAERCLTEVATGLAASGDRVRVFSLGPLPDGDQHALVGRLIDANIPVVSAGARGPLQFAGAFRRLTSWLGQSPPEICQTFLHHANVLGTFAAKRAGVAIRVGGLRVAEAKPLRCLTERVAAKQMQSMICVSSAVEVFAQKKLGCEGAKTIVIPNGVDVPRFASAPPIDWQQIGWPSDSVVALFVGRLHSQKGIDLLQRQVDRIAPAGSNRRLLLVGDGPLRDSLQRWAEQLGSERVKLLPWQADIAPWIRAASLLVLPSRYEGMPNVVLEAMASARPVVCSRVEGSAELLANSLAEQSFEIGDEQGMVRLIDSFLSDPQTCRTVGSENQSRVRRDFSIPTMVDAYRSHYRTLLTTRRLET